MTTEQMRKKFPAYMESIELPECAKEQEIVVYRACRTRKIEKASFLNLIFQKKTEGVWKEIVMYQLELEFQKKIQMLQ